MIVIKINQNSHKVFAKKYYPQSLGFLFAKIFANTYFFKSKVFKILLYEITTKTHTVGKLI